MEIGLQRWQASASATGHDRGERLESAQDGDRQIEEAVWTGGFGAREKLLRSGTGRVLGAPGTEPEGYRQCGRGCGLDRSEPPEPASEDGSNGCGETGAATDPILGWGTRGLERGPSAKPRS